MPPGSHESETDLARTALHQLHLDLGARMVPFAGHDMPIQYDGVVAEHEATRTSAGLFDVGHMGIVDLHPTGSTDPAQALERLVPTSVTGIAPAKSRYTMLTNEAGGVIDDLIVTRLDGFLRVVVNASRRDVDLSHLREHLDGVVELRVRDDLTLVALQGPRAVEVVRRHDPAVDALTFMTTAQLAMAGTECTVSRSGYTGEDGVEIAVPANEAMRLATVLLEADEVTPAGLGARDTLRLEAGLCLYGNDLDETTTPIEADLAWSIQKRRRTDGGFLGAEVILGQLRNGVTRTRVGIRAAGRRPIRDGAPLRTAEGADVGVVTSGGHGPTVKGPVAMGYVTPEVAAVGTELIAEVRGKDEACVVAPLPFVSHNYHRG